MSLDLSLGSSRASFCMVSWGEFGGWGSKTPLPEGCRVGFGLGSWWVRVGSGGVRVDFGSGLGRVMVKLRLGLGRDLVGSVRTGCVRGVFRMFP